MADADGYPTQIDIRNALHRVMRDSSLNDRTRQLAKELLHELVEQWAPRQDVTHG